MLILDSCTGKLNDGKLSYNLIAPRNWNGTVLVSLETLAAPSRRGSETVERDWLLNNGYAFFIGL